MGKLPSHLRVIMASLKITDIKRYGHEWTFINNEKTFVIYRGEGFKCMLVSVGQLLLRVRT